MAIGVFPKNAWFSFALQIIWGLIALVAIIKIINKEKKKQKMENISNNNTGRKVKNLPVLL